MEYHILYVESRKSFKVRREKKLISLPSAKQIHSANIFLCRVPGNYTRQTYFFAERICLPSVSTNGYLVNILTDGTRTNGYPRGGLLPSVYSLPSVLFCFAECFISCSRQISFLPSVFILPSFYL